MRKESYRDINRYRETCKEQHKRYYKRTAIYERRNWTVHEDELVMEHSIPDSELSPLIQRSVQSIQMRRTRLKKE